jgi:hypothetical protein
METQSAWAAVTWHLQLHQVLRVGRGSRGSAQAKSEVATSVCRSFLSRPSYETQSDCLEATSQHSKMTARRHAAAHAKFRVVDLTLKDRRRACCFLYFFRDSDRGFEMHRAIALLALCASVQAFSAAPSGLSLRSYSKDFMVRLRMSPEFVCSVNCAPFCLCPLHCHKVEGAV